jgi:hypothetical protein
MRWEKQMQASPVAIAGILITRRWLIPQALRPKLYWPHPTMSAEVIRRNTQSVWDTFDGLKSIWVRSRFIKSLRGCLTFVLISKIYRPARGSRHKGTVSCNSGIGIHLGTLAVKAM